MSDLKDVAILVNSCDKNNDVWDLFFILFFKYFPDNPFNIYLTTNFKDYNFKNIKVLKSNKITCWSDELKTCLNKINEDYIILFLDDYLIYKPVNLDLLKKLIIFFKQSDSIFMQLGAFPKKYNKKWFKYDIVNDELKIGIIKNEKSTYKISLQLGIWKKEKLLSLLNDNLSPWEFEEVANKKLLKHEKTLYYYGSPELKYVHGPIIYLCSAINRGEWTREALKLSFKEGINYDFSKRHVESLINFIYRKIYIYAPFKIRKILDFINYNFFKK